MPENKNPEIVSPKEGMILKDNIGRDIIGSFKFNPNDVMHRTWLKEGSIIDVKSIDTDPNGGEGNETPDPAAGEGNETPDPAAGEGNETLDPVAGEGNETLDPVAGDPDLLNENQQKNNRTSSKKGAK